MGWSLPASSGEPIPPSEPGPGPGRTKKKDDGATGGGAATPVRVPIGTKLPSGRKKNKSMRGAPRGRKPAGGGVQAAAKAARAAAGNAGGAGGGGSSAAGGRGKGGGGGIGLGSSSSAYASFEGYEIDRAAAREAGKVAAQLLSAVGRLARQEEKETGGGGGGGGGDGWCAPGVGEGDPTGPVFDFLLGEGSDEAGVLLAMAYPDRVAVRRNTGGVFQLSNGNGAASVPKVDALANEDVLAIAELTGDTTGGGARNDRVRLAAPVPLAALEPPPVVGRLKYTR